MVIKLCGLIKCVEKYQEKVRLSLANKASHFSESILSFMTGCILLT